MPNKGFTLIEMVLVLLFLSIVCLLVPPISNSAFFLNKNCEYIKDVLLDARKQAKEKHQKEEVSILDTYISYQGNIHSYPSGVTCSPLEVTFNEKGDVNMANTITCTYFNKNKHIVLHLGNGDVQIK